VDKERFRWGWLLILGLLAASLGLLLLLSAQGVQLIPILNEEWDWRRMTVDMIVVTALPALIAATAAMTIIKKTVWRFGKRAFYLLAGAWMFVSSNMALDSTMWFDPIWLPFFSLPLVFFFLLLVYVSDWLIPPYRRISRYAVLSRVLLGVTLCPLAFVVAPYVYYAIMTINGNMSFRITAVITAAMVLALVTLTIIQLWRSWRVAGISLIVLSLILPLILQSYLVDWISVPQYLWVNKLGLLNDRLFFLLSPAVLTLITPPLTVTAVWLQWRGKVLRKAKPPFEPATDSDGLPL